jgi:hypothetical protein
LQELHKSKLSLVPDRLELGLLGTYWLIAKSGLRRDNRDTPDQRQDSEIIARMLETPRGIYQLYQAIVDGRSDPRCSEPIRAVDRNGELKILPTGEYEAVTPKWLRVTFGDIVESADIVESPAVQRDRAQREVLDAVALLERKVKAAHPHLVKDGLAPGLVKGILERLQVVMGRIVWWGKQSTFLDNDDDQENTTEIVDEEQPA